MSSDIVLKKSGDVLSAIDQISILFIGSSGAGKTSLIAKLHSDKFENNSTVTVGTSYYTIGATINGKDYRIQLFDTAGLERFASMMPAHYRSTDGAMIVYDITDYKSYENIKFWMLQVQRFTDSKTKYPVILLGNKTDKTGIIEQHIDGQKVAEDLGMKAFYKTSAKTGEGIDDAIKSLMENIASWKPSATQNEEQSLKLYGERQSRNEKCC